MYSTLNYLLTLQPEKILLQLADDDGDGSFVQSPANAAYSNVVSAIEEADAIIDSYLSGRYETPVAAPIPVIVRQMSGNLALCMLYDRKREMDVPEGIADRRGRYMKILEDIKTEKAAIPELSTRTPASVTTDKTDGDRIFSDDVLNAM